MDVFGTSYSFTPDPSKSSYLFRVRGVNLSCGTDNGTWSSTTPITINLTAQITGTFYEDIGNAATITGELCSMPNPTPTTTGTGANITATVLNDQIVTGSITGSTFTMTVPFWGEPDGSNIVDLNPGSTSGISLQCTCPNEQCRYSGIGSPRTGVNFFLIPSNLASEGWWQLRGGSAYAERTTGTAISSQITPSACTLPTCSPYVSAQDTVGTPDSAGILISGGGAIDTTSADGDQLTNATQRSAQTYVANNNLTKFREKYDYFYRQYSLGATPPIGSDDFLNPVDAELPDEPPRDGKPAFFHSGDLTIQRQWQLTTSSTVPNMVIFVDGDLIFDDVSNVNQLVTVENGAFLAFIVSGDIIIRPSVGNETLTSNTPNLEGVYVADGRITIESRGTAAGGDDKFVGAGTFVGWEGVDLERNFSDGSTRAQENSTKPTELFMYRPDLIHQVPEKMSSPRYVWQETN